MLMRDCVAPGAGLHLYPRTNGLLRSCQHAAAVGSIRTGLSRTVAPVQIVRPGWLGLRNNPTSRRTLGEIMAAKGISFLYGHPDWMSAARASTGYANDEIIAKTAQAAKLVMTGRAAYERDSVIFSEIQYAWPLLSALLLTAADCGRLHVLDFGGSFGTTYRQNKKYLDVLGDAVRWNIVEQAKVVQIGRQEFETQQVHFYNSIEECTREAEVDIALFLGSIGYLDTPYEMIQKVSGFAKYIAFDRTHTTTAEEDRFAVQMVSQPIYDGSLPIRIISEPKLIGALAGNFTLLESWLCPGQPDPQSRSKGFLFRRTGVQSSSP